MIRFRFLNAVFWLCMEYEELDQPLPDNEAAPIFVQPFDLKQTDEAIELVEGDAKGSDLPISIERLNGFDGVVSLNVETETPTDTNGLTLSLTRQSMVLGESTSTINAKLDISALPRLPEERRIIITANSDEYSEQVVVTLQITPVQRDDIYLLIGQSNMVGVSEDQAKEAAPGQADEPNTRIIQANVSVNNEKLIANNQSFIDVQSNFVSPFFTLAEDPLHQPRRSDSGEKSRTRVGMGLSFAKAALPYTTQKIVLVPAAWSSSAFCNTQIPSAHWNPKATDNSALGNTLLFDRALQRLNVTLTETGGIFRGILWHQGESDSNETCAPLYQENLELMVKAFRQRATVDARGSAARKADSNIPFVVGTMSKGRDNESDYSRFSEPKAMVDETHRTVGSWLTHAAFTNNDDLVPDNGFPCGKSCVHFGAAALREMGPRMHDALVQATQSQ